MSNRNIRYDPECDTAAELLGGYEAIDESLDAYLDALDREPRGFTVVECAWGRVRVIQTKPIGRVPALLWYFVLEANGDVLITNVEKFEPTYPFA